jgi:tetratricopeptide (TPR) repeat protein
MPIPKIGSFSLIRFAALCAVFALPLDFTPSVSAQAPSDRTSFETLAARAESARGAGQADEAIRNYRAAVDLRPSWDEGWWYLGTLLYDSDHFEEAIPALRRVIELQPKASPAWAFLGLSEFETGDYGGAYLALQTARELGFSESPDVEKVALYHLALLLNTVGEFEEGTELLAGAFGPSHFTPQIKVALGLALVRAPILPTQTDPSKDALIHAAGETAVLLANHERDAALRSFEQLLRDYPDTPYLHYQYGLTLAASARYQEAELQFREETQVTPKSALPWIALAKLSDQRNDHGAGLTAARQAVQIAPHSAAAYQALAHALQAQNKVDDAAAASKQAQELTRQPIEVDAALVERYALKRGAAVAKSSDDDVKAVGNAVGSPAANFEEASRLADSERRAGHLEQAAVAYQAALDLRPRWPEGWRQLGTIAYMRGRYPEAISALQQSVALEPKQPDTWTLLGLSEFETKDYKNSLVHLERGRALGFSGNAAAVRISRYHLALLLNRNGDFDQAIDLLIPEIGPGALSNEIQFALGIALLRIPVLPEQVEPDQIALVRKAGEAAAFLSESRYDKAFPIIEKLLSEYPSTRFLHYAYGDALAGTSMYDEAQIQLREETRLNPESALPYIRLASIALQQRHSANALSDAKKAVAIAPESSEAHYLLGRSLLEEGDIPAAIRELEIARRYAPNSPKVHFNLARAYSKADRGAEAQQERDEFERLNALLPGQQKSYGDRAARGSPEEIRTPPLAK